ncbi:MAG TPA: lasso peptide biosynthesis B2 protein [Croceibacterium sp.]
MKRLLAKLKRITPSERKLLAEAVAVLAAMSCMIAFVPFRRVATIARAPDRPPPATEEQLRLIRAVRWAVAASARRVPWRAKCIEQGFAAHWMLRRRAVPSVLHYGVARRGDQLVAHVWVRSGATDVIGCENLADFAEVAQFPAAVA